MTAAFDLFTLFSAAGCRCVRVHIFVVQNVSISFAQEASSAARDK